MIDSKKAIKAINKALEPFSIQNKYGYFSLSHYKTNIFRLQINESASLAYDDYGNNSGDSVQVVKWFNDYWLFVEIKFIPCKENNIENDIIITLSVFQGEESDNHKYQLFRAEWDDYRVGGTHPQPHWHFLTNKSIEKTVSGFAEITSNDVKDTFEEVLNEEKNRTIDVSKIHFAMNGDWNNTSTYIHQIKDENTLARWFGGLLACLKKELEYVDRKRKI